jgi:TetR/AcrR family transcriptional regulator, fatty acid metabolism regulator protein
MTTSSEIIMPTNDKRQLSENKRELIRQIIVDSFSDALYQDVGIRDICSAAGVTPKTIYKHFGNKEALLIKAIEPDMQRLNDTLIRASQSPGSVPEKLAAVGQAFVGFYFTHIAIARIIFLNIPSAYFVSHPDFIQQTQLDVVSTLIRQGQESGLIRNDVEATELSEALAGITMRSMYRYLTSSDPLPTAKDAAASLSKLTTPLLSA